MIHAVEWGFGTSAGHILFKALLVALVGGVAVGAAKRRMRRLRRSLRGGGRR